MTIEYDPGINVLNSPQLLVAEAKEYIGWLVERILASLPESQTLTALERRGIIARYAAVLEGNFIYWMTAAYLSVKSQEAHTIIDENLREEVRDNHPGMLRKFAMEARAVPAEADILAVHANVQEVRVFLGSLNSEQILPMMAFFETFIQGFMPYLADLAAKQGSVERTYTDVHNVVDIGHAQELYRALDAELRLTGETHAESILEGVEILNKVIKSIISGEVQ
jgi:hypothetical protein